MASAINTSTKFPAAPAELTEVVAWRAASDCPHQGVTQEVQEYMRYSIRRNELCAVLLVHDPLIQDIAEKLFDEIGDDFKSEKTWRGATVSGTYAITAAVEPYSIDLDTSRATVFPGDRVAYGGFFFRADMSETVVAAFYDLARNHPKVRDYVARQAAAVETILGQMLSTQDGFLKTISSYL